MKRWIRSMALLTALGFAVPAVAGDAMDPAEETGAKIRKGARDLKPGEKSADDRMDDAKDTAKEKRAQARKKARKAKHRVQQKAHDATH